MKKLIAVSIVIASLLTTNALADWTGSYADLTSRPEYVPSTDIALQSSVYYTGLGGANPGAEGGIGYRLTDFQVNLLYQAVGTKTVSEMKADIEAINDWRYPSLGNWNFPDGENYFLRIDEGGGLPIGNWNSLDGTQEYQVDSGESWVQWTISGWWDNSSHTQAEFHTIFAGSIDDDFLQLIGGYRSYEGDVNPVENFEGNKLLCEISGYNFDLNGLNLEVTLIPEPATIGLLALGGLLLRRKK